PLHLRRAIALGRERHDHVVEHLRDRRAVPAESLAARLVGRDQRGVNVRRLVLEPRHQRRSDVEAHALVVVDDADDLTLPVDHAPGYVRPIALRRDPIVPIAIRKRARLRLDRLEPRVFARRLIEVAVDAHPAVTHPAPPSLPGASLPAEAIKTT